MAREYFGFYSNSLMFVCAAVSMKATSTIKTNIRAAASSHPYGRPWMHQWSTRLWVHL